MVTVRDVLEELETLAPPALAMDFDNVGLLAGFPERAVARVLCALDVTEGVIAEAEAWGAELIVAHHPLIFHPLRAVRDDEGVGRRVIRLLAGGRSAICMHTNLDLAPGGVNDALAEALGLTETVPLCPDGLGRVGLLPEPMAPEDFLALVKRRLGCAGLRWAGGGRERLRRIAVCGGAGGSELDRAVDARCDAYVTADLKYDQLLRAEETGLTLVDADHFCTENVVVPRLRDRLAARFPALEVRVSETHGQTARFY